MKLENAAIFKRKYKLAKYNVEYYLFHERSKSLGETITIPTNPKKKKGVVALKHVCFSGLMRTFTASKLNRICYKPKVNKILKPKDISRWIDIAKEGRLLPTYVKFEHLKKTFLLRCNIPPSLLYVYLCTLRDLEEEPDFVRITSYLIKEGMDIHAAVVAASSITINNSGHHYLGLSASYYKRPITSIRVSLTNIFQLKKFLMNPSTYDKRSCTLLGNVNLFSAQNVIGKISVPEKAIPITDLFEENIVNMLSSGVYNKNDYNKYTAAKEKNNVASKEKA